MEHISYIGIGSNLGDKLINCNEAIKRISLLKNTEVVNISKWYANPALTRDQKEEQPDYINGVVKIKTNLKPSELLFNLKEIETVMGRPKRHLKWSARIIDLDLLLYDNLIIETKSLKIPHPEMTKRTFVLKPICDIEPWLTHPVFGKTIDELLKASGGKR